MTHPLKSRTGEVMEGGGRRWRFARGRPPPTSTDLHRLPPSFGAVAASIPKAKRSRPHPASLPGTPVARSARASAYTRRVARMSPPVPVRAATAPRTRGGGPRRSARSAREPSGPGPRGGGAEGPAARAPGQGGPSGGGGAPGSGEGGGGPPQPPHGRPPAPGDRANAGAGRNPLVPDLMLQRVEQLVA